MITVVINGQNYNYPEVGDTDWGSIATLAFDAITKTTLQPVKDLNDPSVVNDFTLYNDIDFGPTHGLRVVFIQSRSNNPAATGVFRLAKDELVAWRNEDNDGDNTISFDADGDLIVNGVKVTLHGQIVNDDIAAAAGIEESKLALDYSTDSLHTAIENHVTDTNNPHSVTKAQILTGDLIVNSDVDSSAAIDESKLNLDYSTDSLNTAITTHVSDTNNPHSVTKAQVLTGDLIVNADVDASAAIAESKLDLDYSTSSLNTAITTHTGNTSNPHSTSVSNLTDTTITSANSGDVLSYDGSKWVNSPSTSSSLSGLSDTDITTPANGDTLVYNNVTTKWENSDQLSTLDTTVSSHVGNKNNPHSTSVSKLTDTNILTPIGNMDVLAYDDIAGEWTNVDYFSVHINDMNNPHNTSVDNLTDSDIDSNTLTENDVLVFNDQTSKWENSQIMVNHIGNASNPHLTTVSKLTDTSITTPQNGDVLVYDYANTQWINSQIVVNDIANINTATTNVTLTISDKRHQIFTSTTGFDVALPSTDIKAGEKFVFDFPKTVDYFSTPFTFSCGGVNICYAHNGYFTYILTATVNNPTSSDYRLDVVSNGYLIKHGDFEDNTLNLIPNARDTIVSGILTTLGKGIWESTISNSSATTGTISNSYASYIITLTDNGDTLMGYDGSRLGTTNKSTWLYGSDGNVTLDVGVTNGLFYEPIVITKITPVSAITNISLKISVAGSTSGSVHSRSSFTARLIYPHTTA